MPDDLKFHILTGNEAERYTLIKVEPDIPAASEEEDATVRERQTDAVTALAELDPRKDDVRRQLLKDTLESPQRERGGSAIGCKHPSPGGSCQEDSRG